MTNSISNLTGATFRVGDRVRHYDGWIGTITTIDPNTSRCLFVEPDCEEDVPAHMRWTLNPQAARQVGRATYCRPRDGGLSMGCYTVIR